VASAPIASFVFSPGKIKYSKYIYINSFLEELHIYDEIKQIILIIIQMYKPTLKIKSYINK
jgi:hypothetical protein